MKFSCGDRGRGSSTVGISRVLGKVVRAVGGALNLNSNGLNVNDIDDDNSNSNVAVASRVRPELLSPFFLKAERLGECESSYLRRLLSQPPSMRPISSIDC